MATQAQAQPPSGGPSGTTRWVRSEQSGTVFGGLSRGGRGRGRGGNPRGRNGRGRGTTNLKEEDNTAESRPANQAVSPIKTLVSSNQKQDGIDKPASATSTKPKPASRRQPRQLPPIVVQTPAAESPSPVSARSQNRRKRPHAKQSGTPKIPSPIADNNNSRNKLLSPAPFLSSSVKGSPHLSASLEVRSNIDALVERVRAVAMADNRPSTPGSHIDWAGDDDDSLPDLDDWGVNTSALSGKEAETMSPIIVGSLKPLPELVPKLSTPPSQPKETIEPIPANQPAKPTITIAKMIDPPESISSLAQDTSFTRPVSGANRLPGGSPLRSQPSNAKVSHPSLPAKPATVVLRNPKVSNSWRGATPMRPSPIKHVNQEEAPSVGVEIQKANGNIEMASLQPTPAEEGSTRDVAEELVKPNTGGLDEGLAKSIHAPTILSGDSDPLADSDSKSRDGLAASIHAPSTLSDSLSAPDVMLRGSTPIRSSAFTHSRSHTVGRHPVNERDRLSRSGTSTPHGSSAQGKYHSRTHSTPPSNMGHHRLPQASRPVITGDAISRLARTIGNTSSTPKSPAVSTIAD